MTIVITGNPGVGKHTIAKEISQKKHLVVIDINEIAKNENLFEKNDETNDVDTEKLKEILRPKISTKSIIVGHLAPYVLDKNQIDNVIVLRRNPYDLLDVYTDRGYSEEKSRENAGSEILGVTAFDAINQFEEKVVEINVSDKKIPVVEKIEKVISGKKDSEQIDWLELVTKNDDLKKFFVD
ncbi:AAA family ATPase [Nitrosopumilus sp.]|uniref:adenylate kinase family protein n=1 Tax=Nitrosopumilus sp. TaxID=2024843 RepID=UPI0026267483|nr:AAA family ATPase [Nitrosopumilus sp.]